MMQIPNVASPVRRLIAGLILVCASATALAQPRPAPGVETLLAAYPEFLDRIEGNDLVWKDGTRMPVDDGTGPKPPAAMIARADIKDMLAQPYRLVEAGMPPPFEHDPGRARYAPLFEKMYGDCRRGEVERNLVEVAWLPSRKGGSVRISRINGAAAALARVSAELDRLPDRLLAHLVPAAGTYNCRPIAGTDRISAHGHGIAIDIALHHAHYWRWSKPGADGRYSYRNAIPLEIVRIFESHGFIWGGRWYHYDTMHFEFRPELLVSR